MKQILFICHDANRTGAPIFLLNFLRWLKENTDFSFVILVKQGGELVKEFEAIAPTFVFYDRPWYSNNIFQKTSQKFKRAFLIANLRLWLKNKDIQLIYSNTITNGDLLGYISHFLDVPIISHIHELEMMIQLYPQFISETTKKLTQYYIACSIAVKQNLIDNHNINENCISVIYGAILAQKLAHQQQIIPRQKIRQQLAITGDCIVVGGCGTIDWRKGTDLFVQLALNVINRQTLKPIHFVWLGGNLETEEYHKLQFDIDKANLSGLIHFVGTKTNPFDYFASFDIFTLTSREDPFPLVCLEAASFGKPIICFDNAGGMKEFVEDDCGFIIDYGDVNAMAEKIITLTENKQFYQQFSTKAIEKVTQHHDLSVISQQIVRIIDRKIEDNYSY